MNLFIDDFIATLALMQSPELFPWHLIIIIVLGLIVGSFINVCIYRIPANLSIVYPGSHCTTCGHYLKWYENVPVVSYLALGGMCKRCGAPFSARYMMVEMLTAAVFGLVFWQWGYNWAAVLYIVFACMLIVGTFTDIDHWIIPDSMTLGGAAVALALTLPLGFIDSDFITSTSGPFYLREMLVVPMSGFGRPESTHAVVMLATGWQFDARLAPFLPLLNAVFGAVFGYVMLWVIGWAGKLAFRKEAMGMGDVKLFAFVGAVLGWINCVWVIFLASFIGLTFEFSFWLARRITGGKNGVKEPELKPEAGEISGSENEEPGDAPGDEETPPEEKPPGERVLDGILASREAMAGSGHHLPFGPYIAIAAFIVLLASRWLQGFLSLDIFVGM